MPALNQSISDHLSAIKRFKGCNQELLVSLRTCDLFQIASHVFITAVSQYHSQQLAETSLIDFGIDNGNLQAAGI